MSAEIMLNPSERIGPTGRVGMEMGSLTQEKVQFQPGRDTFLDPGDSLYDTESHDSVQFPKSCIVKKVVFFSKFLNFGQSLHKLESWPENLPVNRGRRRGGSSAMHRNRGLFCANIWWMMVI